MAVTSGAASPQDHGSAPGSFDLGTGQQRIEGQDARATLAEARDERQRARVGELLDPLAIGQPEDEDGRRRRRSPSVAASRSMTSPTWPSLTSRAQGDEFHLGRAIEQEMRVDRDAVAADAEPGLVDVAVRLAVGRRDDLEDVDARSGRRSGRTRWPGRCSRPGRSCRRAWRTRPPRPRTWPRRRHPGRRRRRPRPGRWTPRRARRRAWDRSPGCAGRRRCTGARARTRRTGPPRGSARTPRRARGA